MTDNAKEFVIEFVAVNSCSFNAPVPVYRLGHEWQPTANLELDVITRTMQNNQHEVDLKIEVKVTIEGVEIFAVHVIQTGAFTIKGYDEAAIEHLTQSFCPTVLYPYARETIAGMVAKAGFPQLHLSPVDFEGRFQAMKDKER